MTNDKIYTNEDMDEQAFINMLPIYMVRENRFPQLARTATLSIVGNRSGRHNDPTRLLPNDCWALVTTRSATHLWVKQHDMWMPICSAQAGSDKLQEFKTNEWVSVIQQPVRNLYRQLFANCLRTAIAA